MGDRPAAHLAVQPVRNGVRRIRRRRLADLLRHRHQDDAGQGRPHPFGDGVRQIGRGGPVIRPRSGGPGKHRAAGSGSTSSWAWHWRLSGGRPPPRRPRIPPVLLARGRVEREVGDGDSALAAFQGYLEQRAQSEPRAPRDGAYAASCWAASTGSRPTSRAPAIDDSDHRRGLPGATSPRSRPTACWASSIATTGQRRADYLRRFWSERDRVELRGRWRAAPRALPPPLLRPQELPAHLRSIATTTSSSAIAPAAGTSTTAASSTSATASQRSRATYAAPSLEPNESWRYARPDGDLIFHFMARRGRAGLQAGRESVRRARLQQRAGAQGRTAGSQRQSDGGAAAAVAGAARPHLRPTPDGRPDQHRALSRTRSGRSGRRASR